MGGEKRLLSNAGLHPLSERGHLVRGAPGELGVVRTDA
jgi:hypothetical protein